MAKIFVQDIVPAGKRSIRNIPLPVSRAESTGVKIPRQTSARNEDSFDEKLSRKSKQAPESREPRTHKSKSRLGMWVSLVACVLVLAFVGSFVFVSATVTVAPREITLPLNTPGSATAGPSTDGALGFTLVTLSREGSKQVPAGTEERVDRKASGKVVIYNSYSTSPQTLVANTRFESPTGLIFRIQSQVIVPGMKTVNGVTTPGSIAATIYADAGGEKYNIGLSDFTIPGFKGDPRYAKFSAKSDPKSPITGGFVGTEKKVTASDLAAAKVSIETQLKSELQNLIESQIPETHVLFKGATTFDFNSLPQESSGSTTLATIREQGTVYGILFSKSELSKFLASRLGEINGKDVAIDNFDSLTFSLSDMANFDPKTTQKIDFTLAGDAHFVWNIDTATISNSLAGQKRANIKAIMASFESIDRANVSLNPVWVFTLPKNPAKITVQLENES
jgi:hypothetical protein